MMAKQLGEILEESDKFRKLSLYCEPLTPGEGNATTTSQYLSKTPGDIQSLKS